MQEIDASIDNHPELAKELVLLDIRNQSAHNELQSYNDTHAFLFIHSLSKARKFTNDQFTELSTLKAQSPEAFLNEVTNIIQNIRRIESQLRTKKYKSDTERQNWELNLTNAKMRQDILKTLLKWLGHW